MAHIIRAHSSLPGPLMNGNELTDKLTWIATLSKVELAQQSHAFHHQKSTSLKEQFGHTSKLLIRLLSSMMHS